MSIVDDLGRAPSTDVATVVDIPNLIEIQTASYHWFLKDGLRSYSTNFSPSRIRRALTRST